MSEPRRFYASRQGGAPGGPYTVEELRGFLNAQQLDLDDQVCVEGAETWERLGRPAPQPRRRPDQQRRGGDQAPRDRLPAPEHRGDPSAFDVAERGGRDGAQQDQVRLHRGRAAAR